MARADGTQRSSREQGFLARTIRAAQPAAILWLPLLAFDLGYPSVQQVLTTPVLLRALVVAAVLAVVVTGVLAGSVLLGASRRHGEPAGEGFAGVAAGSATLAVLVLWSDAAGGGGSTVNASLGAGARALLLLLGATALATFVATRLTTLFARRWLTVLAGLGAGLVWSLTVARASLSESGPWLLLLVLAALLVDLPGKRLASWRKGLLVAVLVLLAMAPALRWSPSTSPAAQGRLHPAEDAPSVVVLVIDTWRWDATTLASAARDTTPRLAALAAKRGTIFSAAAAPAPSTLPSMKAVLTGRPASHFGVFSWGNRPPPADTWTMAEAFHSAGYDTAGWTANSLVSGEGFDRGFDRYWSAGGLDNVRHSYFLDGIWARRIYRRMVAFADALRLHKTPAASVVGGFERWLGERAEGRPFFAYLHLVEPHFPYRDHGHGLIPEHLRDVDPLSHMDLMPLAKGDPSNAAYRTTRELAEMVARYREEVAEADRYVGRVADSLERYGVGDNTLVVVVGDHGEEFFEHDGFGHGHDVYEELVHVPLVALWPRGSRFAGMPSRVDRPVSLLDLLPTLSELLALPAPPEPIVGRSLAGQLRGEAATHGVSAEMIYRNQVHLAYRRETLKARFVFDARSLPSETAEVMVFDLSRDPGEQQPLQLDAPDVVSFLELARTDLDRWWEPAREATLRSIAASQAEGPGGDDPMLERLEALGYL